jgi:hypothetical protein
MKPQICKPNPIKRLRDLLHRCAPIHVVLPHQVRITFPPDLGSFFLFPAGSELDVTKLHYSRHPRVCDTVALASNAAVLMASHWCVYCASDPPRTRTHGDKASHLDGSAHSMSSPCLHPDEGSHHIVVSLSSWVDGDHSHSLPLSLTRALVCVTYITLLRKKRDQMT